MSGGIVLDASAAIAVLRREQGAGEIARALRAAIPAVPLLVPDVFWLETANVLIRRRRLTPAEVVEALRELDELGLDSVRVDRALLLVTLDLAGEHSLSTFDAAYLALAEVEDARLLTLDRALADAAGPRAIRLTTGEPRRLSEQPATYGSEPIDWARFGPYLAQLRATARTPRSRGA